MRTFGSIALAALAAACSVSYGRESPPGESSAAQTEWPCYAPKPGHPTPEEKAAFISAAAAAAQEAERTYGAPAAALLAMAAQESGFGFTRTALEANNLYGYKYSRAAAAAGRTAYTLTCQPDWDVGNEYIVFADRRDAVLFVGQKLATRADWADYKSVTDRYRADRRAGVSTAVAVQRWIEGIADAGYNYDPPTYKRTLERVANDYLAPSDRRSPARDLYRYSEAVSPGPPSAAPQSWVDLSTPTEGARVSGAVALRAAASPDVTSIRFITRAVGGSDYVLATKRAPFDVTWETVGWVPDGAYELRVVALIGEVEVASETVPVTVDNP